MMDEPHPDFTGHDLSRDPHALTVVKRPVRIAARYAETAGILQTREGPVGYQAGDALLDDRAGHQWPVRRARFDSTYDPLQPARAGEYGSYVARPISARARRIETPFTVRIGAKSDVLSGMPGDWLVQYEDGRYGVVAAAVFEKTYRQLD